MAASGLHVFVLAMLLRGAFSLLPIPRERPSCFSFWLSFCFTRPLPVSDPRSVGQSLLRRWRPRRRWVRRESDLLSALGLAGIVCLVLSPESIYEMGFQISFLTVAAFSLLLVRFQERQTGVLARFRGRAGEVLFAPAPWPPR